MWERGSAGLELESGLVPHEVLLEILHLEEQEGSEWAVSLRVSVVDWELARLVSDVQVGALSGRGDRTRSAKSPMR